MFSVLVHENVKGNAGVTAREVEWTEKGPLFLQIGK